jgi:hypothetical protein
MKQGQAALWKYGEQRVRGIGVISHFQVILDV